MNTLILMLFLAALVYFVYEAFKMKELWSRKKLISWLGARLGILILLFLAWKGFGINLTNNETTTIFLADASLSVSEYKKEIEDYINYEIENKSKNERYAVIGFGEDTVIEVPLTYEKQVVRLSSNVKNNFTNLEKALDFSIDYFPENNNKKLVVITDKNENKGDINALRDKVKKKNVNIMVKEINNYKEMDVQLSSIEGPDNIEGYESIPLRVVLESNYEDSGYIYIYMNGSRVIASQVQAVPGENIYEYTLPLEGQNEIFIRGEIDFPGDENKFNNTFSLERRAGGIAKVLVISEKEEDERNINRLLDNLKIERVNYAPGALPDDLNFLSDFNLVILANTEYQNLPQGFADNLEKAVGNFGTGFLAVGGENSFALGGYEDTKLEGILPVSSRMQGKREQGDTGLVLLVDCSGSMDDEAGSVKKIELAKKGAAEAIKALEEEDYIGVLAFSDTLEWVVPYQKAGDKDRLTDEVEKLKSKGGTLIIPGLIDAAETLKNSEVKVRHIILLTDGQAEKDGFDKYIEEMKENNITLSTVAVGEDCDREVLDYLSGSLEGRQYYSTDFRTVPQIISKETRISQKKYLNNDAFEPKEYGNLFNTGGYELPDLKGYMGTGIKNGAEMMLASHYEDPILAVWDYGIGKAGAWTPDLSGKWSEDWIGWEGFNRYWSSIIDYLKKGDGGKNIRLRIDKEGGNVGLLAVYEGPYTEGEVSCTVTGPDNLEESINMVLSEKGEYAGSFSLNKEGRYKFTAFLKEGETVTERVEKSIYLDFSPEYELKYDEIKNMDRLIAECNGKYLNSNESVFDEAVLNKNVSYMDLSFIMLPMALLIFLVDILLRMGF
ncbi:VWA domain-containing protein [Oxobacter pfennigii]|nr:VWA domain-containing protein [Oxobacter pfennigii]